MERDSKEYKADQNAANGIGPLMIFDVSKENLERIFATSNALQSIPSA